MGSNGYVPSRFNSLSSGTDDGSMVVHNSLTGAIGVVSPEQVSLVQSVLHEGVRVLPGSELQGILADLHNGGMLVPEGTDERALQRAKYSSRYGDSTLHLIILPTEKCNFRCVYCYESFEKGRMSPELLRGIRTFVSNQTELKSLTLVWFGGEPLLAPDIVKELSGDLQEYCLQKGITFNSAITTNGYLLSPEISDALITNGVKHFQITLDGTPKEHNKRRPLAGGGGTFDAIMDNLLYLKSTSHAFVVSVRHNFDVEGLEKVDEFIDLVRSKFGGDPRFQLMFEAIGKWGSPNDDQLPVLEGQAAVEALAAVQKKAVEAGFRLSGQVDGFGQPDSFVCYAANPRSFVIGADGSVYKCTVELDYHERNVVGRLHPDGTMDLDRRKMALWTETNGMRQGKKCVDCFFSPACYGAACPKQWMDKNDVDCPHEKVTIQRTLPLLVKQSLLPDPPKLATTSQVFKG